MAKANTLPAWAALEVQAHATKKLTIGDLQKREEARAETMHFAIEGLSIDLTHALLDQATLNCLCALAHEQDFEKWRDGLFSGEKINITEQRAALHTALRDFSQTPVLVDGQDVKPQIVKLRKQMETLVGQVRGGQKIGHTGKPFTDIVNIGIGGSDLGPRLVAGALSHYATGPRVRFVANVDGSAITETLKGLCPETTLFVIVSKTFSTQETTLNAQTAKAWLEKALGTEAIAAHFVAVSANSNAAKTFGVSESNILPMWDWIGGRFSLWSSVGLSAALAIGWDHFENLLKGAEVLDHHFHNTPPEKNIPALMAMIGVWYRNFKHAPAVATLPYSERLHDLPRYLQQLDMESNGKSVTREGNAIPYDTGPIVFGECGSTGQHSLHQWLHQGTTMCPAEFIGIKEDADEKPEHHKVLLANMLAQIEALSSGCDHINPAQKNGGNKPSTLIWIDRLDPHHLGMLLALYEHKVFCQGVLWGINSFDQFGVELGKKLAANILRED